MSYSVKNSPFLVSKVMLEPLYSNGFSGWLEVGQDASSSVGMSSLFMVTRFTLLLIGVLE